MGHRMQPLLEQAACIATEIIYVDGGSKDNSCELVARYPRARIIERPFDGNIARQKNIAIDHARCDWVLIVDTDELLGPRLLRMLPRLLAGRAKSVRFPRYWLLTDETFVLARRIYPDRQLRLFRNVPEIRYNEKEPIHHGFLSREDCEPCLRLKTAHILHYCLMWLDLAARERKVELYNRIHPELTSANDFYLYEDMPHRVGRCREGWTAGRPYLRPAPVRGFIDRYRLWRVDRHRALDM